MYPVKIGKGTYLAGFYGKNIKSVISLRERLKGRSRRVAHKP